jgi:hypothetical protein
MQSDRDVASQFWLSTCEKADAAKLIARHREAATADLRAELQIAQKVIRSWTEYGEQKEEMIAAKDAEIEALRAENERLREALVMIQNEAERQNGRWVHLKRCIAVQSRAALKDSQP